MTPAFATTLGLAAGVGYFLEGEKGIPKESNCSYLSPWTTDALAWLGGAILVTRGFKHDDPMTAFIGATVASIHIAQFAAHKVGDRPTGLLEENDG